jgi:hypothetical protein
MVFGPNHEVNIHFRGNEFTDYRAYLIDASSASIRFLTTVTTPHYSPDYHATGDILAIVVKEGNNYFIDIRKIPFSADVIEEEAFLNLGHTVVSRVFVSVHH